MTAKRCWPAADPPRAARSLSIGLTIAALSLGLCSCGASRSTTVETLSPSTALAEAQANAVAVSPLPGTQDASPATAQISFLGRPGTKVTDVSVVGSRSGPHSGKLVPYSTHDGASFLLNRPFDAGEQVAVHALVGSFGHTPETPVTTVFTVAPSVAGDSVIRLLDPKKGLVRWEWHALGHVPTGVRYQAVARPGGSGSYVRVDPAKQSDLGAVLVSSADAGARYEVDIRTGAARPLPAGPRAPGSLSSARRRR